MSKLQEHKQLKAHKVNGWDIISAGLGIAGTLLIGISAIQPKNPINIVRVPFSFLLFAGSVTAERLRESDLLSLDRALEYEKAIKSERIKIDTTLQEQLHHIQAAEEFYAQVPIDRHAEVAAIVGMNPPNHAARQLDPMVQAMSEPVPQTAMTEEVEPTGDDPETREASDSTTFIMAANVAEWFKQMGDRAPEALLSEWKNLPGIGIEITGKKAFVVRQKND
jgi:hypothetical protein